MYQYANPTEKVVTPKASNVQKIQQAYRIYRDQKKKNLRAIANELGISQATIYFWYRRYNWKQKAQEEAEQLADPLYNLQLKRHQLMIERLERRSKLEQEALERAQKYRSKADKILSIPLTTRVESPDGKVIFNPTNKWSLRDAIVLHEAAEKLEKIALGIDPSTSLADQINEAIALLKTRGFLVINPVGNQEMQADLPLEVELEFPIQEIPQVSRELNFDVLDPNSDY